MTNGSSSQAIQDAANSISQMRNDISAMVADIRNMNSALSVTSSKTQNAFQAGGSTSGSWGMDFGRIAAKFQTGGTASGVVEIAKEAGKTAFKAAKDTALASYNDLRVGRDQAMQLERQRLIARGGTGDFTRFQDNLNISMNDINVQDKWAVTKDLANAYSSYYAQAMGGGIAGEQRTAMAIGGMHTLASIAGVSAEAVGGATGAMYSSQAYYKAMAAGIQTRNPVTGDMLSPEEIVNQYRKRLAGNTPEEIKRALGPGGTLRAELMQTWGDPALVEMVSKGLVMSSEMNAPLKVGDIQTAAMTAGGSQAYAGTEWTQGKDTDSLKQGHEMNRIAEYTNDITAGIATSNVILADINAKIADLGGWMRDFFGATETFGGIMDQFLEDMPQTTMLIWEQLKDALSNMISGATSANPFDFMSGLSSLGTILGGAFFMKWATGGAAKEEPEKTGEYPSGEGGSGSGGSGSGGSGASAVQTGLLGSITPAMFLPGEGTAPEGAEPVEGASDTATNPILATLSDGGIAIAGTVNRTTNNVSINLTVAKATDAEATRFANRVKVLLADDEELIKAGEGSF